MTAALTAPDSASQRLTVLTALAARAQHARTSLDTAASRRAGTARIRLRTIPKLHPIVRHALAL
eukprot:3257888-Prymnesium_polylepis.1